MGAVCGRGEGFMMRGPIKGAGFFAPAVKAGAGLSHIVSKDSRVDSFPSLIVYGMAELSADYSSRFTEWRA